MKERLTYWKCNHCHGTGKLIVGFGDGARTASCDHCDGTGNGLVDGPTERHKRRVAEIETKNFDLTHS
jgi:DnaJ-class molecular chaperone